MHKGYAFVQFTNPFDARNACHGEDGRTILSQVLGECIVASLRVVVGIFYHHNHTSSTRIYTYTSCHLLQLRLRAQINEKQDEKKLCLKCKMRRKMWSREKKFTRVASSAVVTTWRGPLQHQTIILPLGMCISAIMLAAFEIEIWTRCWVIHIFWDFPLFLKFDPHVIPVGNKQKKIHHICTILLNSRLLHGQI